MLDHSLERLITLHLPRRDDTNTLGRLFRADHALLEDLDAKNLIAFALNIISEQLHKDLSAIRRVRNVFSHAASDVSFETTFISAEILKIRSLHLIFAPIIKEDFVAENMKLHFLLILWTLLLEFDRRIIELGGEPLFPERKPLF